MTQSLFIQLLVSGIGMGFIFALIAIGLTLIYGVMDVVNFAHGEFLMIAMYASYLAFAMWGLDPLVTLRPGSPNARTEGNYWGRPPAPAAPAGGRGAPPPTVDVMELKWTEEDFAESARAAGVAYDDLVGRLMALGMSYQAEWRAFYG